MRCKCKVLSVNGIPASDGSVVPLEVMNSYINSQECKEALEKHKMIGSLTHRSRTIASVFPNESATLSKTVGKDDSLIIVSDKAPAPTHYIDKLYIEDGWLWCEIKIFEEEGMDDIAIQNIRRLKGMLKQGVMPGVSAVIVGYWNSNGSGTDTLGKCVNLKGIDVTLNPSWKAAGITEILPDTPSNEDEEDDVINIEFPSRLRSSRRFFSDTSEDTCVKCKTFSDISSLGLNIPKSSKINGQFTSLKVKEFSSSGAVFEIPDVVTTKEKTFSAAQINERLRFAKLSPRLRFRRLILDYRQGLKAQGGINKIDPESLNILKSLFASDVLNIMNTVTPLVLKGKNLNTLLGAGSLGVQVRKAAQDLYMPYRLALQETERQGFVTKQRYQKIQNAYLGFIRSLQDYVFGTSPLEIEDEDEEEGKK